MSYVNAQTGTADRLKGATTTIAIHALLAVGVVAGLTVSGKIVDEDDGFKAFILPDEEIPPPPPPPPEDAQAPDEQLAYTPPTAPEPIVDLVQDQPVVVTLPVPSPPEVVRVPSPPMPTPGNAIVPPRPSPSPAHTIAPVGAVPNNGPTGWITNEDYSNSDLRRGNEGVARYRLVIGSNGRVNGCEITSSTGHASLDRATCRLISNRARFDAATDNRGERVVGTYSGSVTWQIPE